MDNDGIREAFRADLPELLDDSPFGLVLIRDDHILYASAFLSRLTGYSREDLGGMCWSTVSPEREHETAEETDLFRLDKIRIKTAQGETRWLLSARARRTYAGAEVTILKLADITQWEEPLRRKDRILTMQDAMIRISQSILKVKDIRDFYDLILEEAMKNIEHAYLGSILVLEDEETLVPAAFRGFDPQKIKDFRLPLKRSFAWVKTGGRLETTVLIENVRHTAREETKG